MKMTKSIASILIALLLCAISIMPAFAEVERMVDNADLLTSDEKSAISDKLDHISAEHACDIVIVTVDSLDGKTATEYADDYFDYNGYGYGSDYDGILFLISMEYRDYAISTCGYGITAFTDAGQSYIIDRIKSSLSDDEFYDAFDEFADLCDDYLTQADKEEPYDTNNLPATYFKLSWLLIAVVIGLIIALIVVLVMRGRLKTVYAHDSADNYERQGSMNLRNQRDLFLYRTVSKTEKPKNTGGGSSTHTSSSGRTHGGSGGKF